MSNPVIDPKAAASKKPEGTVTEKEKEPKDKDKDKDKDKEPRDKDKEARDKESRDKDKDKDKEPRDKDKEPRDKDKDKEARQVIDGEKGIKSESKSESRVMSAEKHNQGEISTHLHSKPTVLPGSLVEETQDKQQSDLLSQADHRDPSHHAHFSTTVSVHDFIPTRQPQLQTQAVSSDRDQSLSAPGSLPLPSQSVRTQDPPIAGPVSTAARDAAADVQSQSGGSERVAVDKSSQKLKAPTVEDSSNIPSPAVQPKKHSGFRNIAARLTKIVGGVATVGSADDQSSVEQPDSSKSSLNRHRSGRMELKTPKGNSKQNSKELSAGGDVKNHSTEGRGSSSSASSSRDVSPSPNAKIQTVATPGGVSAGHKKTTSIVTTPEMSKFDPDELEVLTKIYKELGARSSTGGIEKETFLQYFPLPGLWGERLYQRFDHKKLGYVDFEEFISGLAVCSRGTKTEQIRVLFEVFDLDGDNKISRRELTLMLSNVPSLEKYVDVELASQQSVDTGSASRTAGSHVHATDGTSETDIRPRQDKVTETEDSMYALTDEELASRKRDIPIQSLVHGKGDSEKLVRSKIEDKIPHSHQDTIDEYVLFRKNNNGTSASLDVPIENSKESSLGEAECRSMSMEGQTTFDIEGLVNQIMEDYESTESSFLLFPEFKTFIQHFPLLLKLFTDCMRDEVWALQGLALYRLHKPSVTSRKTAIADGQQSGMSSGVNGTEMKESEKYLPTDSSQPLMTSEASNTDENASQVGGKQQDRWIKMQSLFKGYNFQRQIATQSPSTELIPSHSAAAIKEQKKMIESTPKASEGPYPKHTRYSGSREVLDFLEFSLNRLETDDLSNFHAEPVQALSHLFSEHFKHSPNASSPRLTLESVPEWSPTTTRQPVDDKDKDKDKDKEGKIVKDQTSWHKASFGLRSSRERRNSMEEDLSHALICPNCHAPLLVCPICNYKFPELKLMKNDQVVVSCNPCKNGQENIFHSCWICNWSFQKAHDLIDREDIIMEGQLYKVAKHSNQIIMRHFVLIKNLLYYYTNKDDSKPKGFIFLEGCFVDAYDNTFPSAAFDDLRSSGSLPPNSSDELFGFSITHFGGNAQRRELFAFDSHIRDNWLTALRNQLNQQAINELYELKEIIGHGKFSIVYRAVEKATGKIYAMKVINKSKMQPHEKELLRSEMSILRLMRHSHVIYLKSLIDSKDTLYIVMEFVKGGELYDVLTAEGKLPELVVHRLIAQLLRTIAYLHKCGIVHRDLKPENILLTSKCIDEAGIKIADFGLSCLCGPNERLIQPCGTLVYVAPDVFTLQGYNQGVDIWSAGVILHLLLTGRLPFPVVRSAGPAILTQKEKFYTLKFDQPVWNDISQSAQDLISKMCEVDPQKRLTAEQCLDHIWIKNPTAVVKEGSASSSKPKERETAVGESYTDGEALMDKKKPL